MPLLPSDNKHKAVKRRVTFDVLPVLQVWAHHPQGGQAWRENSFTCADTWSSVEDRLQALVQPTQEQGRSILPQGCVTQQPTQTQMPSRTVAPQMHDDTSTAACVGGATVEPFHAPHVSSTTHTHASPRRAHTFYAAADNMGSSGQLAAKCNAPAVAADSAQQEQQLQQCSRRPSWVQKKVKNLRSKTMASLASMYHAAVANVRPQPTGTAHQVPTPHRVSSTTALALLQPSSRTGNSLTSDTSWEVGGPSGDSANTVPASRAAGSSPHLDVPTSPPPAPPQRFEAGVASPAGDRSCTISPVAGTHGAGRAGRPPPLRIEQLLAPLSHVMGSGSSGGAGALGGGSLSPTSPNAKPRVLSVSVRPMSEGWLGSQLSASIPGASSISTTTSGPTSNGAGGSGEVAGRLPPRAPSSGHMALDLQRAPATAATAAAAAALTSRASQAVTAVGKVAQSHSSLSVPLPTVFMPLPGSVDVEDGGPVDVGAAATTAGDSNGDRSAGVGSDSGVLSPRRTRDELLMMQLDDTDGSGEWRPPTSVALPTSLLASESATRSPATSASQLLPSATSTGLPPSSPLSHTSALSSPGNGAAAAPHEPSTTLSPHRSRLHARPSRASLMPAAGPLSGGGSSGNLAAVTASVRRPLKEPSSLMMQVMQATAQALHSLAPSQPQALRTSGAGASDALGSATRLHAPVARRASTIMQSQLPTRTLSETTGVMRAMALMANNAVGHVAPSPPRAKPPTTGSPSRGPLRRTISTVGSPVMAGAEAAGLGGSAHAAELPGHSAPLMHVMQHGSGTSMSGSSGQLPPIGVRAHMSQCLVGPPRATTPPLSPTSRFGFSTSGRIPTSVGGATSWERDEADGVLVLDGTPPGLVPPQVGSSRGAGVAAGHSSHEAGRTAGHSPWGAGEEIGEDLLITLS